MEYPDIHSKTKGKIIQRQLAFVRVALSGGDEYKIHYLGKEEFRLNNLEFTGISISTDHPLLGKYNDSWSKIYISSPCDNPQFRNDLKSKILELTEGWRRPEEFLNYGNDNNLIELVEEGFGLLYSGPSMLGKMLIEILEEYKVKHSCIEQKNDRNSDTKALFLGQNVVVAEDFVFEKCSGKDPFFYQDPKYNILHSNEGKTNNYFWIEIDTDDVGLPDLVTKCPEIFIGRAVAITSCDSSPIGPNNAQRKYGWYSKDKVFYAPEVTDPQKLPFAGYDEWYVFDDLKEFKPIEAFVNNSAFCLTDPSHLMDFPDPEWDKVSLQQHIDFIKNMQAKFWDSIQRVQPRSFVMNGDPFIFGSRFADDIELIKSRI